MVRFWLSCEVEPDWWTGETVGDEVLVILRVEAQLSRPYDNRDWVDGVTNGYRPLNGVFMVTPGTKRGW